MIETTVHGMRFEVAAFSEQGPRAENQDAYSVDGFADRALIALADGMGGEKSGRRAADRALEALLSEAPIRSLEAARRAVRGANDLIGRDAQADPERYSGMGCALALLSLADNGDGVGWIAAHVGDVRILSRSPDGVRRLETRDHTPAFARWEAGEIALDEIPDSAGANRLQRAVGRGGEADVVWLPAAPGWSWLIISDGVSKALRLEELAAAMSAPTVTEGADALRRKVAERGADDNYTAVLVRAMDDASPRRAALPDPTAGMALASTNRSGRGAGMVIATGLALVALIVAGIAFIRAGEANSRLETTDVERLRVEVDSIRVLMDGFIDPLSPTAPQTMPDAAPPGGTP
ncbi:MAG TPA: PP2C family serine/threonine-protein phosphatase [Longimicrobiaceae bacterium]|nr:PP2C family serine/threonine-protein phosphatase [Longimicrobiaceae bacterium]